MNIRLTKNKNITKCKNEFMALLDPKFSFNSISLPKQKCRGVSWYHQLHSLQLIAVCLGKEMKINESFGSSSAINSFLRLVMFLFFVNLIFI